MREVQKGVNKKITGVEPRKRFKDRVGVSLENVKRITLKRGLYHISRNSNIDLVKQLEL